MAIENGTYTIQNAYTHGYITLANNNEGTPLNAGSSSSDANAQWKVTAVGNGRYKIESIKYSSKFANTGYPGQLQDAVVSKSNVHEFKIVETTTSGQYNIVLTNNDLFWGFDNGEVGTSVTLRQYPTDSSNKWVFAKV
ncbi:uncharacterized protein LAESUDRAFT_752893 [Laetiporus sulphureus 93-53]|uniref:Ricin B lectin domain-containing protein n=1 Tax=Laetiporus sulphureus 93-53 TaxID=1314785 RepID=A0A165BFU9_9APHY|nr:uncharacterized protein LAESUDRAFT_752893 [Laetiporus sulphureus 93-53]KZT00969.1 hypothetical protein LAESUDRAFT_752893 [Laetiporus sulphureus 93-53]